MKNSEKKSRSTIKYAIIAIAAAIAVLALGYLLLYGFLFERNSPPAKRAEDLPYLEIVRGAGEKYGVEMARIYAVIQVESSFKPAAESKAGAIGLMQMLPATYEELCEQTGNLFDPQDLKKPEINIDYCTSYLKTLYEYTGSWSWAHVAYFSGIGNVNTWRAQGYTLQTLPSDNARAYLDRIETAYDAYALMFKNYVEKDAPPTGALNT